MLNSIKDHFLVNGPIASSCTRRLVQWNLSLITKNLSEKRRRRKILINYHLKKSVLALKGGFELSQHIVKRSNCLRNGITKHQGRLRWAQTTYESNGWPILKFQKKCLKKKSLACLWRSWSKTCIIKNHSNISKYEH